jgi:hypothetical protein
VSALGVAFSHQALALVRRFDAFTQDNDPHKEHDFASPHRDAGVAIRPSKCYQLRRGSTDGAAMIIDKLFFGVGFVCLTSVAASATIITYDPADGFASGWTTGDNPNGDWSYGYSSTFGGAVTLYDARVIGSDSSNELFWVSSSQNCCVASPAVGINNGPAFDDGNVALGANQLDLVSSVYQNLVTDLVFTAPSSGTYAIDGAFTGSQRGIGVSVEVLVNNSPIFSSTVTSFGEVVPFSADVYLAAGNTVEFEVLQGEGLQNTGFDVSLTTSVPEPETWSLISLGFLGLGLMGHYRRLSAKTLRAA